MSFPFPSPSPFPMRHTGYGYGNGYGYGGTQPLLRKLFLEAFGLEVSDQWFEQKVQISLEDLPQPVDGE